jgi:hypothetical protein
MAFSFGHRSRVAHQAREIAKDQIDKAQELSQAGEDFDKTVHELRRRCKKIRGLLRLIRPNFSDFGTENACFAKAADSLSASRDAAVMVETFNLVARDLLPDNISETRGTLEDNVRRISAEQDRTTLLSRFGDTMDEAAKRVKHWDLDGRGFALLAPGLHDTYGRMRKRIAAAEESAEDEAFHDWRKDTKSHWFHISLLAACAPDVLGARRDQLDQLGEYLGDHHNLAVLAEGVVTLTGSLDRPVAKAIERHKVDLAQKALALGRQLTVESPSALVSRVEKFWKLLPKDN